MLKTHSKWTDQEELFQRITYQVSIQLGKPKIIHCNLCFLNSVIIEQRFWLYQTPAVDLFILYSRHNYTFHQIKQSLQFPPGRPWEERQPVQLNGREDLD
jgi:hypothetical protein